MSSYMFCLISATYWNIMLVGGGNMVVTYEMLKNSLLEYKAPENKIKRMCNSGEIVKLARNLYETDPNTPGYLVANSIYSPSYISFDYALAYYGLIPEAVYVYTCATYKKNKKKQYVNKLGTFTYRDVPSEAYPYDIIIVKEGEYSYLIASPEKALCDKLYSIAPVKNKKEIISLLFDDLRIDPEIFKSLDFDDLLTLCDFYKSTNLKLLKKVIGNIYEHNSGTDD